MLVVSPVVFSSHCADASGTTPEVPNRTCQHHGSMVRVIFAWVLQCIRLVVFTCKAGMCIPEAVASLDALNYFQTCQHHVSMVLARLVVH